MSQQDLAGEAEVSTRHISFLETGRSTPSRSMVLVLASSLDLPLRERNLMLTAAGYASVYRESPLESAAKNPVRRTLDLILGHHEPYPAIAVTPVWDVVDMNPAALRLVSHFVADPADPLSTNLMHAMFNPAGLRDAIVNWDEVSGHAVDRMHRDALLEHDDRGQRELIEAISGYPGVPGRFDTLDISNAPEVCLPVHLKSGELELRLFTTLSTLGTPIDVTAQELRVEAYFPADDATDAWLREGAAV
jgi:transcriptional regulator with XRE-family HTH domain